jgi:hypothetical protein
LFKLAHNLSSAERTPLTKGGFISMCPQSAPMRNNQYQLATAPQTPPRLIQKPLLISDML